MYRATAGQVAAMNVQNIALGCHFSRDDFLGIFNFFYRLPSKLAMNLVVPSFSLMSIFLPAFWPSSAQSLVLSACEA